MAGKKRQEVVSLVMEGPTNPGDDRKKGEGPGAFTSVESEEGSK